MRTRMVPPKRHMHGHLWSTDCDMLPKDTYKLFSIFSLMGKNAISHNAAYKWSSLISDCSTNTSRVCVSEYTVTSFEDGGSMAALLLLVLAACCLSYPLCRGCKGAWWGRDAGYGAFWYWWAEQREFPKGVLVRNGDVCLSSRGYGPQGRSWPQHLGCFHPKTRSVLLKSQSNFVLPYFLFFFSNDHHMI